MMSPPYIFTATVISQPDTAQLGRKGAGEAVPDSRKADPT